MTMWLEELTIIQNENNYIDWRNGSEISDFIAPSNTEIQENLYKFDLEYMNKKP